MKTPKMSGPKRLIYARLSGSEKFNLLLPQPAPTPHLLYCLMLAHTDDFGRYEAEPATIKFFIVPGFDWSHEVINNLLTMLQDAKLIKIYNKNGKNYLEYTNFDKAQRFDYERIAKCPAP